MNLPGYSRSVILCIDDQETALELRKRVLEREGYQVLTATSANRALEIFRENRVNLVLTEHVVSTTFGGPTLAATMKMLKPEVPVAVYSADGAESPEDMRFADIFITKLVSVDELLPTIEKLLTKGRLPSCLMRRLAAAKMVAGAPFWNRATEYCLRSLLSVTDWIFRQL